MQRTKYQKFDALTISRGEIKNAPYNPRKIEDKNKSKLKKNIKKVGLIETLVVNKLTMNLVSGHQRLRILDGLEQNSEYQLTVAMVELSEEAERKQNVFMNNPNGQGDFDVELLADMVDLETENYKDMGLDIDDLAILALDSPDLADRLEAMESQEEKDSGAEIKEIKNKSNEQTKKDRQEWKEKRDEFNDDDFFISVVFRSMPEKVAFLQALDLPDDIPYLAGNVLAKYMEIDLKNYTMHGKDTYTK
ncbi:MAG: ParB N-terminal domain-containing protein [bacterium]|nr:ParB N-terminal domain-containing protein [bacterium]